ncbi:hypothetical protein B0H67DRAFT_586794 [Lasiosphaeris hirsuta]|uniref:Uncharacterized protein n=1 Tax=Lasiosphaeris hirsuta TaxID=260670 RepID=A0AA40AA04_9PEZI|nr:hypothetical protein B0H67DRAFT_586794 [Lasiosphaeris hirsuta]
MDCGGGARGSPCAGVCAWAADVGGADACSGGFVGGYGASCRGDGGFFVGMADWCRG